MENNKEQQSEQLYDKQNYIILGVGIVVMLIGYFLMAGGNSADPNVFAADEIYSFRRITLAPMMVLAGLGIGIYAIMKKPSSTEAE